MESNNKCSQGHSDLLIAKDKIFKKVDLESRKTKIICTLGYVIFMILI
jgi:hypothetical protein